MTFRPVLSTENRTFSPTWIVSSCLIILCPVPSRESDIKYVHLAEQIHPSSSSSKLLIIDHVRFISPSYFAPTLIRPPHWLANQGNFLCLFKYATCYELWKPIHLHQSECQLAFFAVNSFKFVQLPLDQRAQGFVVFCFDFEENINMSVCCRKVTIETH